MRGSEMHLVGSTPDLERINDDLLRFKEIDRTLVHLPCPPGARDVYYGVVDGGADTGGLANGIPGQTASGHIGGVSGRDDTGYARNRAPHEDRAHARCSSRGRQLQGHPRPPVRSSSSARGWRMASGCAEVASSNAPGLMPFVDFGAGEVARPRLADRGRRR